MSTQITRTPDPNETKPAHPVTQLSGAQLLAELDRLRAENARLAVAVKTKPAHTPGLTFKVSEKGACSVYGVGRFPVTLYSDQWQRLLSKAEDLRAFLKANEALLASKDKAAAPGAPATS